MTKIAQGVTSRIGIVANQAKTTRLCGGSHYDNIGLHAVRIIIIRIGRVVDIDVDHADRAASAATAIVVVALVLLVVQQIVTTSTSAPMLTTLILDGCAQHIYILVVHGHEAHRFVHVEQAQELASELRARHAVGEEIDHMIRIHH